MKYHRALRRCNELNIPKEARETQLQEICPQQQKIPVNEKALPPLKCRISCPAGP